MAAIPLGFQNATLDWVTSFDESSEVHSEAFVLYDGTTKYAPVDNAGRTLTFGGTQKGRTELVSMETKIGLIGTVSYPDAGNNASMTITDFSYTYRAYDASGNYYYDWSITFGQTQ